MKNGVFRFELFYVHLTLYYMRTQGMLAVTKKMDATSKKSWFQCAKAFSVVCTSAFCYIVWNELSFSKRDSFSKYVFIFNIWKVLWFFFLFPMARCHKENGCNIKKELVPMRKSVQRCLYVCVLLDCCYVSFRWFTNNCYYFCIACGFKDLVTSERTVGKVFQLLTRY